MRKFFEFLGSFIRLCVGALRALFAKGGAMKAGILRYVTRWTIFPTFFLVLVPYMPLWATRTWSVEGSVVTTWTLLVITTSLAVVFAWWYTSPTIVSRPRFVAFGFGCALGVISSVITLLVLYGVLPVTAYVALLDAPTQMFQAIIIVAFLVDLAIIWHLDKGNAG